MKTLSLLAVASILALAACGGGAPAPQAPASPTAASPEAPAAAATAAVVENGQAKVGDRTKCPVMGHDFTVTAESPKVEHEGKTYYLCCPGCVEKFKADPAKYVAQPKS